MWDRAELARNDSDTTFFFSLMYLGEMLTKVVVAALVAAIDEDSNRTKYGHIHKLIRADGLGEWSESLVEILGGPSAQLLSPSAYELQRELNQRVGGGAWQYEAVMSLYRAVSQIEDAFERPTKPDLRLWFAWFVQLRNKTRGHGAPSSGKCRAIAADLEKSLSLMSNKLSVFQKEWVYLHQNMSGKFNVVRLTSESTAFDSLKSKPSRNYQDGVYIDFAGPRTVDLVRSDVDLSDFFIANGAFVGKTSEWLSYITGSTIDVDATAYHTPTSELPPSETRGLKSLDLIGNCYSNIPPEPVDYIRRGDLEDELRSVLLNERHPIITLTGRGGIGKTSLTLAALHSIVWRQRFAGILWFSARDIDLLPEGPKVVKPSVLTEKDIARDLVRLLEPSEAFDKGFKPIDYFTNALATTPEGPLLFVFDNFETVHNQLDLYKLLDTHIRSPNKILITTRHHEFKGDYSLEVQGMSEEECGKLIRSAAQSLNVQLTCPR